jgi:hypothetical protein
MHATRAYIAGFGTAGSLLAGAAMVFVLASAVVAFRGWPQVGQASPPPAVVIGHDHVPATASTVERQLIAAVAPGYARGAGGGPSAGSGRSTATGGRPGQSSVGVGVSGHQVGAAPTTFAITPTTTTTTAAGGCGTSCAKPTGTNQLSTVVQKATGALGNTVATAGQSLGSTVTGVANVVASKLAGLSSGLAGAAGNAGATAGGTISKTAGAAGGIVKNTGSTLAGPLGSLGH